MKHNFSFYQKAKEMAEKNLEESIRQEAMLCEEEREALHRERQEEAAELIEDMRKKSEADTSVPEEDQEKESKFLVLQAKAVRLARKLALNLKAELEGDTGRLVFSASDIIITECYRQETYELFRELLDSATLIWFLADGSCAGQIQLYLEYCYLEGGH